jgi:putative flippase GtrA
MLLSKLYNDAFGKYREATLYIIFGGLTTVVNWGAYALFVWAGIEINLSNILSWVVGVSFAFVVNKWYVFESKSLEKTAVLKEFGSFVGSRVVTGVIAVVLFPILYAIGLNQSMFGIDGLWAKIVTSIIEIILNWVFSKYIVFKNGAHSQ